MPILTTRRRLLRLAAGLLAAGAAQPMGAVAQARMTTPDGWAGRGAGRLPLTRQVPSADPFQQQSDGESGFETLLRMLPDGEGHRREVYLNDFALAARQAGLQPPAHDADDEAFREYMPRLRGTGITSVGLLSGMDDFIVQAIARRKYLAFGVGNVTHAARIGSAPREIELVLGTFDPNATEAALNACTECAPPVREMYQNVPFYSWGEDFALSSQNRFKPPAHDQLGRGGRIAVQPELGYRTLWTEGMHWAIEARQATRPTLAEVTPYRVMSSALAGLGAYTLFLTDEISTQAALGEGLGGTVRGADDQAIRSALDPTYLLRPYLALTLGAGTDEAGPYMTVGLLHPSPELAAENVGRLPERIKQTASIRANRRWSELWGDVDARAEGEYLFARIRRLSDHPLAWLAWWVQSDSLLYWG